MKYNTKNNQKKMEFKKQLLKIQTQMNAKDISDFFKVDYRLVVSCLNELFAEGKVWKRLDGKYTHYKRVGWLQRWANKSVRK